MHERIGTVSELLNQPEIISRTLAQDLLPQILPSSKESGPATNEEINAE